MNHPHICQLYDIGSQNGTDYLVMEFLEGETLAERLRKGAMPLAEVYKIGIAVAEALAVAHRSGIVHRDLKPGNIMLTAGRREADGLRAGEAAGSASCASGSGSAPSFTAAATMSGPSPLTPLTTAGSVIGTIQYMSPEQIEGKEADARSDIFAFGAVLYEMAAGKRPFAGKSQISLASSILESEPEPVSKLKPNTPPAFEHVVTTCLQKNPEERYLAAHDIKLELQWIAADKSSCRPPAPLSPLPHLRAARASRLGRWRSAGDCPGCGCRIFPSPFGTVGADQFAPSSILRRRPRFNLTGDFGGPPVLSPDGASVAFAATRPGRQDHALGTSDECAGAPPLPGTANAIFPFWSPDSRSLGFFAEGKLKTIDLDGGSAQIICDAPFGRGGAWGPDGVILFAPEPDPRA